MPRALVLLALLAAPVRADDFADRIRPLLNTYCQKCHSEKRAEAEIDLGRYASVADVSKDTRTWQKIADVLDTQQMPPPDAKQPTEAERQLLRTWVRDHLKAEAKRHAGDPGRVVLRRLSHSEYTYTLRDLTGVPTLDPAKEFPADGAAGEGFTNTGDALVMSPALLTKYLDAAKGVAAHAVLTPDGLRFSPHTTRSDWTNETLDRIRGIYHRYSDPSGGSKVALQGLVWDGKEGGRLPVEKYLAAAIAEREALTNGTKTIAAVAAERGLSPRYLEAVWRMLTDPAPSPVFDPLRARWRANDPQLAAEIGRWQNAVWRFSPVGHIGKLNGPKAWLEPVNPLVGEQTLRRPIPPTANGTFTLYLSASDAGDGNASDVVVWERPRFVAPGRPELLLKDVRAVARARTAHRTATFAAASRYLQAADEADAANGRADVAGLAKKHQLDAPTLAGWLDVLGIGTGGPVQLTGHLADKILVPPGVAGWGKPETPCVLANDSDKPLRIPGDLAPHGFVVHPSPSRAVVVGWQSPVAGRATVTAKVRHAHPGCGNGVTWAVDVRRGATRQRLLSGTAGGGGAASVPPIENLSVSAGDVLQVVIGPRDTNHACDLTAVDLSVRVGDKTWELAKAVTPDIHAGNPHSEVWHFLTEPADLSVSLGPPKGSLLDRWRTANAADRVKLAADVQRLLTGPPPADSPDAVLHRQLSALGGPLFARVTAGPADGAETWGVDPARFGVHPTGAGSVAADDLCVRAPAVVEVPVPADLVAGYELVTRTVLHPSAREQGSVQVRLTDANPAAVAGLRPDGPILVADGSPARARMAAGLDAFRDLFPTAVCYSKIVPVDEVVTLTLYHREDQHLARLMLTDAERADLDRLWGELHYVSRSPLVQVDAFRQLMEYATQDADPKVFEPLRQPTLDAAAAFRRRLVETEPKHLDAVLRFADQAFRRPLTPSEKGELFGLYRRLRSEEVPHEDAVRLTLARVLVSPTFLYKLESPGPGTAAVPVTDHELAARLSYFLWSSAPDAELRTLAAAGQLRNPDILAAQARRMLADERVRRLAVEFGCQWLHVRGFDRMNEKSERHFPTFAGLRADMDEETVRLFTDFFQADRRLFDLIDSDAAFLNQRLAAHYGIPGVTGDHWRRVEGVRKYGRGGILTLATTLSTQAGASRTSPTLRGNWVSEVLLGEKLSKPPKGVPPLPDDEADTAGRTVRQLVEKHATDVKCAVCHRRIDGYGFALEAYDPIGRRRTTDLGGRPVDVLGRTADGAEMDGLDGLRAYLLGPRRAAFERQFCRKLLGYALGRAVQLSDEPVLDDMQAALKLSDGRVSAAVEAIVRSRPFREIRGSKHPADE